MSRPDSPSTAGSVVYDIHDRPPVREAIPLACQHLFAMLLGNVTPPLLVAGALGLDGADTAFLVQVALLASGIATLVQSYPLGPVGGRLPIIMGTSFAFVGPAIAIGREGGLGVVLGASLVAAVVEVVIAGSLRWLRPLFPPLVTGTVLMLIGLTLIPVGMDYAAGGVGVADYGSLRNLGLAALVFAVTLLLSQFARGFLAYASVLVGVVAGTTLALVLGRVDASAVAQASWLAVPRPLSFGLELSLPAVLTMMWIYVVSAVETVGDISGTTAAVGREPSERELSGGLLADGVMSALAALLGALPNTSYSQNVGLVNFSGVASRHVTAIAGGGLVLMGLVPKVGALFAAIPPPVIGGGGLIMFAMIFASGVAIVQRGAVLSRRNLVILAVGVGLGLGVELRPDVLSRLPGWATTFFGSGLITGGLGALALNLILPGRRASAS